MDAPRKRRFRFGLKAILGLTALCAAVMGIFARRTDPLLARKGMSKAEIWWKCGNPNYAIQSSWVYFVDVPRMSVNLLFDDGVVIDANGVRPTNFRDPEVFPLPYVPETDVRNYPGKDADSSPRTE